ncbi:hypothetical protein DIPPA_17317 [Diplonema papillatum]|nr:hypothetical protein DIPPA_17317 [Diplonema papillatum]
MDVLLRGPSAWGGVYERHGRKETPAPKWEAFEKDFRAHIPRADAVELNAITAADLRKTLSTMNKNTAPGAEGWRVRELAALPDEALRRFAELFAVVEKTGKWPESLMRALVSLIPKGEGGFGPMDLRPISVTSAVYRLWAATRLRMLMEWKPRSASSSSTCASTSAGSWATTRRSRRLPIRLSTKMENAIKRPGCAMHHMYPSIAMGF